jgi:hypothetical protein
MSEERLNDDLAAIEAALCSLTPKSSSIQRDRLMFLAGRASVNPPRNALPLLLTLRVRLCQRFGLTRSVRSTTALWPLATAASLAVATTFGILWATSSNRQAVQRPSEIAVANSSTIADPAIDTSTPSPWENRRLCRLVLEKGVDALPEETGYNASGTPPASHEETYRSLLKQFLDNPTG